jgi:hypothetical protein
MKNLGKLLVLFVLLLSLAGCAAIPNPSKPTDSLLVGRMTLEAKGADSFSGTSVNGNQKSGINITLLNSDTQKEYKLITHMGFFYLLNPDPGKYIISKLSFESDSAGGSWANVWWSPRYRLPFILVDSGKVINLGSLQWTFEKYGNSFFSTIKIEGTPEELKTMFTENYPKSLWLDREWVNIKF